MRIVLFVILPAAFIFFTIGFDPRVALGAAECSAGDVIDGSSADTARMKIEKAGFAKIHDLKKGCDNYWHGKSIKDDATVNVVLSPQGDVRTEGN